ncbi:MAG: phenylalanine--tRNA ligase subunit beta [Acidobacteria bacterium]|nr:phenylalanine--tRNA ligase subunit beta [Acidobacteriota bacterium]
MKISYNWLKEFVDINDAPQEVGRRLTEVGLALDGLESAGNDHILELDIATNRPDCLSHIGVARELSVIYPAALRTPRFELREGSKAAREAFSISIADPDLCGRYCGRYIEGVKIGSSPDWLQQRLEALGVRSINNVADVTNYVMLELGQPLHAFDTDTLAGHQIIVRRAELDEKLITLDGIERELNPATLLIADAERGVAIAGVMGGAETEISPATKNVLLESANFNPLSIRKTSRALGLSTEASYRFERGADIVMAAIACDRAAAMIQELAGGTIYGGIIDVYPGKTDRPALTLRRTRINKFLGAPVDDAIVERILRALGFELTRIVDGWAVVPPTHRVDAAIEEDLLEEIARHHGYDKFPATLPAFSGHGSGVSLEHEERLLRNRLSASGYTEVTTFAFSDESMERTFRKGVEPARLLNPMAEDEAILRTSLLPSILRTIQWNMNRGVRDLQLYELGKVYMKDSENRALILAATGLLRQKSVHEAARDFNFYDLKGDIEDVLREFNLELPATKDAAAPYYHPGRAVRWGDLVTFGELHPEITGLFKLKQRIYIAELDVDTILRSKGHPVIEGVPRYPSIRHDLSLLVNKGITYEQVRAAIPQIHELIDVEPFDRLETGPFPESKYSLAISLTYQSSERTLTDAEVLEMDSAVLSALNQRLGIEQRK